MARRARRAADCRTGKEKLVLATVRLELLHQPAVNVLDPVALVDNGHLERHAPQVLGVPDDDFETRDHHGRPVPAGKNRSGQGG